MAVDTLATGLDLSPLVTASYAFLDAGAAFESASRHDEQIKVQIAFPDQDRDGHRPDLAPAMERTAD
jgi:hypothetical protein